MIPVSMSRPSMAKRAAGILPVLAAFRANATRLERVPDAPTGTDADPAIRWLRNILTLRTEYFHFSHSDSFSPKGRPKIAHRFNGGKRCSEKLKSPDGAEEDFGDGAIFAQPPSGEALRFDRQRLQGTDQRQNHHERDDMQRAGDEQHRRVTKTVIEQVAGELTEHDAAQRAAQAHESRHRAEGALREKVCGQNHHEG